MVISLKILKERWWKKWSEWDIYFKESSQVIFQMDLIELLVWSEKIQGQLRATLSLTDLGDIYGGWASLKGDIEFHLILILMEVEVLQYLPMGRCWGQRRNQSWGGNFTMAKAMEWLTLGSEYRQSRGPRMSPGLEMSQMARKMKRKFFWKQDQIKGC